MSKIIAIKVGRPSDFELRVLAMVLVTAPFEATQEWIRRGGRASLMELVTEALDFAQIGVRLDELERRQPEAPKRST